MLENTYSEDVKILTHANTKFVLLFDKKNQTITAYTSNPLKTNTAFQYQYALTYAFRLSFDLPTASKIIDATIAEDTGNSPVLYMLNAQWVYQVNLDVYIKQYVK